MTVSELVSALGLTVFCAGEDRPVTGGYAGDLLSWVMGRAPAGGVWVTIMSNVNVAAVAHLSEVACVLLAEGVAPDAGLRARMEAERLWLLGSEQGAFALCGRISALL